MIDSSALEQERLQLLALGDAGKTPAERNRLGQFATPPLLASDVVAAALALLPARSVIRYLEPGFGTGAFYSALLNQVRRAEIRAAVGYEIDPHYAEGSRRLWSGTGLDLHIADFMTSDPPETDERKFNLIVCNPPYVRHHHLDQDRKRALQAALARHGRLDLNGLSGLYCYFMLQSQAWMSSGGVAAWLVPSEFMDVNYGQVVKRFLLEQVSLLRVHRFDPKEVQFGDALVSSAVVFFRNARPGAGLEVEFSFGGAVTSPRQSEVIPAQGLRDDWKWTGLPRRTPRTEPTGETLADLFHIKRGVATGCNEFFILIWSF